MMMTRMQIAGEVPTACQHQRHRNHGNQGQPGIEVQQHDADPQQLKRLQQEAAGHVVHQGVQCFGVPRDAAHEHAHLVSIVKRQR